MLWYLYGGGILMVRIYTDNVFVCSKCRTLLNNRHRRVIKGSAVCSVCFIKAKRRKKISRGSGKSGRKK
jgi:hypothetical protein